jgi:hypothetical protein
VRAKMWITDDMAVGAAQGVAEVLAGALAEYAERSTRRRSGDEGVGQWAIRRAGGART